MKILLKGLKGSFRQSKIAASRQLPSTRKLARHDRLTGDTAVKSAPATLSKTSNPKVSLGRPNDYASHLAALGDALALSRQAMLKQLAAG